MNDFSISVETDHATGDVLAVYFKFRRGRVAETREFADGDIFVDYNSKGQILGIELLSTCKISLLDKIARRESQQAKDFLRKAIPRQMVAA